MKKRQEGSTKLTVLCTILLLIALGSSSRAATITGTVVDIFMNPAVNVDIDMIDRSTGISIPLVLDMTDVNGIFSVAVPDNESYDVLFTAPIALRLVTTEVLNISVSTATVNMGTTQLDPGALLQGQINRLDNGFPIVNVNLDARDALAGGDILIDCDQTDLSGNFAFVVPLLTIHLDVKPAPAEGVVAQRVGDLSITGDLNLGTIAMEAGAILTGQVIRMDNGNGVEDADTDVDRTSTGQRVLTPGDNTDQGGIFSVIVPLTTVNLTIEPQKADRLVGLVLTGIVVTGDRDLGLIPLESGFLLSGIAARASDGSAVESADIDIDDPVTGLRIPTAGDDTDASGNFSVVVPAGTVDLTIEPLKSDRLVAQTQTEIPIAADTNIGILSLDPGALLSGRVIRTSDGTPVVDTDTDSDDAFRGTTIPTPGDNTDTNGNFSVVVPFGTIEFTIEPQKNDRLVAHRIVGQDITGDTNIGDISLDPGFLISGTVTDPGGTAAGVGLAVFDQSAGTRVHAPDSISKADGTMSFVLPAGTYFLKWSPPLGDGNARLFVENYVVSGDQVINPVLAATTMSVRIGDAGHLVDAGNTFRPRAFVLNNTGAPIEVRALIQAEVPTLGVTKNILPPIDSRIPGNGRIQRGQFPLPIPGGIRARFRGIPIRVVFTMLDRPGLNLLDTDFIDFEIR